jgi:glycosyltransferase involved in cell wall biosynthesis
MVSVIIPTLNEEKALPVALRHLLQQFGDYEVIVVDGGSLDRTCEIVRGEPRVRLLTASRGRASQMNTGAQHASGEWLLFLHADTVLPDSVPARLNRFEGDVTVQAGGFLHQFSGTNWRLRMLSYLNNVRRRWSMVIYGDQAMFGASIAFRAVWRLPGPTVPGGCLIRQKAGPGCRTCSACTAGHHRLTEVHADGHLAQRCPCLSHTSVYYAPFSALLSYLLPGHPLRRRCIVCADQLVLARRASLSEMGHYQISCAADLTSTTVAQS